VRELRTEARVPAVVYGPNVETQAVSIDAKALHKALIASGTGLLGLKIGESEPVQVLAREVQHHPFKRYTQHVDFLAVAMNEALRLRVPIVLEGTAPALQQSGIVLIHNAETVEVECMPADIPQNLKASLSRLQTPEDSLYVRDLVVPPGVTVVDEPDHLIVSLAISRAEAAEAEAAEAEAEEEAEVEVVARGKAKEEEEE
jgi:large subunit ribosomal protein L25